VSEKCRETTFSLLLAFKLKYCIVTISERSVHICVSLYACICLHLYAWIPVCVCVCAVRVCCVSQAEIMTMMTVAGPTGARGAEWWRMTEGWALMAHRQWVMTAHPSQCSTLHYLYGEKHSTKAGRAALSLPSNDICSWRQPHYRSSFTSLSLHLSPSMVIFLAPFLFPFSLALCHPLRGGYAEVRQWDNDSPLSTFQIRAFSSSLSSVVLSFLILSLLIFSYSLVLMRLRGLIWRCRRHGWFTFLVNWFKVRCTPRHPWRHMTVCSQE